MRLRVLLILLAVFGVLTGIGAALSAVSPVSANIGDDYCVDQETLVMFTLINQYRADHGVGPLKLSYELGATARHHTISMLTDRYFDRFIRPENKTWWELAIEYGVEGKYRGEVISWGETSAEATLEQLKGTTGNDKHLLDERYVAIGISRGMGPAPDPTVVGGTTATWAIALTDTLGSVPPLCEGVPTSEDSTPTVEPPPTESPISPETVPSVVPPSATPTTGDLPIQEMPWCTTFVFGDGTETTQCARSHDDQVVFEVSLDGRDVRIVVDGVTNQVQVLVPAEKTPTTR